MLRPYAGRQTQCILEPLYKYIFYFFWNLHILELVSQKYFLPLLSVSKRFAQLEFWGLRGIDVMYGYSNVCNTRVFEFS